MALGLISISTWSLDIYILHLSPFCHTCWQVWGFQQLLVEHNQAVYLLPNEVLGCGSESKWLLQQVGFIQQLLAEILSLQHSNFCPEMLAVPPSLVSPENLVCTLWVSEHTLTDCGLKADTC